MTVRKNEADAGAAGALEAIPSCSPALPGPWLLAVSHRTLLEARPRPDCCAPVSEAGDLTPCVYPKCPKLRRLFKICF